MSAPRRHSADGWTRLDHGRTAASTLDDAVYWDATLHTAEPVPAFLNGPRRDHSSVLNGDGRVSLSGAHTVALPSPTTQEVVVTTPFIPGLELHIPPNTVIRGEDGEIVRELGITPIPVDRPSFPLAKNVSVPVYFTIQPGSAYVHRSGTGVKGARLVYPNYHDARPGELATFWHYDPEEDRLAHVWRRQGDTQRQAGGA